MLDGRPRYFYLHLGGSCALLESQIYPVFGPRWSASETVPLSGTGLQQISPNKIPWMGGLFALPNVRGLPEGEPLRFAANVALLMGQYFLPLLRLTHMRSAGRKDYPPDEVPLTESGSNRLF